MAKTSKRKKVGPITTITLNSKANPLDKTVMGGITALLSFRRYRSYDGTKLARELLEDAIETAKEAHEREKRQRKRRRTAS